MIGLGVLAVAYVVMVVAVILQIRAWGRECGEQAARDERRHHKTLVDLAISTRRQEEEHAGRMHGRATPGG